MPIESTRKRGQASDESRGVLRRFFERIYSKGELDHVDEVVAPGFNGKSTVSPEAIHGPEGVKAHVIRLRTAVHGFAIEIDRLTTERDTFEVSWMARGTHERRFLGIDPTCNIGQAGAEPHGNQITVPGISTGIFRNGQIHETAMIWDMEVLHHQLESSDENVDPE